MVDQVLHSPTNPHFFQPLLPGFDSHLVLPLLAVSSLNIPLAFSLVHVQGRNEIKTAKLRSDASAIVWEVRIDGRKLTEGWREFVAAHDLRIGDVIVFRHEGDLVFHVTALGPSCCEIEYTAPHNIDDDRDDHKENIASDVIRPMKKRVVKKNPRKEEDSSSDHSCFVVNVSASNLHDDKVYVPVGFVRSNGLCNTYCRIVLLDQKGRSWNVLLSHSNSGDKTYLRHGWTSFCNANGMTQGHYTFKLIRKSGTPVIRLCQPYSEASSDSSCFVGSLTPSNCHRDELYLPRGFVRSNDLIKEGCSEMVLKNEYGRTWNLLMRHNKANNSTVICRGWRSFCQVNGIKARDVFRFKLVITGKKPVLCLCSTETKRDTGLVECSEGKDVHSLSENSSSGEESSETEESDETRVDDISVKEEMEEASIEEKASLRECLNIQKWKYCARGGASSSQSRNRFVTLTITPYSIKSNKLRLPLRFMRANGINKSGTIHLLAQNGVYWTLRLVNENKWGRMRIGGDWKGFCHVHGVKIGEPFEMELIWENDGSPVLKFLSTKVG